MAKENEALKPLLENDLLTDEAKTQITEAYAQQLEEAREEIETNLREEFTARYEHDKGILVDAVERMVDDGIRAEIAEFVEDRKLVSEQRVKLANEIRETRINSKKKIGEQMKVLETFVLSQLKNELGEFNADRKIVREAKKELHKKLRESRVAYKDDFAKKTQLLESFVLGQLKKEMTEFHQDQTSLVNQRVKMIKEGKAKINQTRKEFIKRSSKLVESTLEKVLRKEMSQLREDIESSRQKHFGMKLFEAYAAEFKASFFNENKTVRNLEKRVVESHKKLSKAKELFEAAHQIASTSTKRQKLAESKIERSLIMNELLNKLTGKNRDIMAELLDGVKTTKLRESFKKYIPAIATGTGNTVITRNPTGTLVESRKIITGNKETKLYEDVKEDESNQAMADIIEMKRLAGLN